MSEEIYPNVSIIVPVYNEESNIGGCLNRLLQQTYAGEKMEILIIDGLSVDKTTEVIREFERQVLKSKGGLTMPSIQIIGNPKRQRAPAMNIGFREAKHEVILRVDARTRLLPDYIEKCVKTLLETGADNVGGVQKPLVESAMSFSQQAIGMALSHPYGPGNARFRLGQKSGYVDTVYLGCFRRRVFDKVGLFDEESAIISEDADMNYRIRKSGGGVYLNKDIIAYYCPPDKVKDLWRLYLHYGKARAGNFLKHHVLAIRQCAPPVFVVALLLFPILGVFNKLFFYLFLIILLSYLMVDFLVSLSLAFSYKMSNKEYPRFFLLWRLFFIFPVLHLSWGLGFWTRLLQNIRMRPLDRFLI